MNGRTHTHTQQTQDHDMSLLAYKARHKALGFFFKTKGLDMCILHSQKVCTVIPLSIRTEKNIFFLCVRKLRETIFILSENLGNR